MQTIKEIRALLDARDLRPKHRFGQNFLHDQNQLARLVAAAEIAPGDLVLEIGPGTGTLTETLLEAGANVIACELDRDLADLIEERFQSQLTGGRGTSASDVPLQDDRAIEPPTRDIAEAAMSLPPDAGALTLIHGDCLDKGRALNPAIVAAIAGRPFKLVANLPYQIASPLMSSLLTDHPNCTGQFITIQREVADRLLAVPSTKAYGPLSIIVQAFATVKKIAILKPTCFWPQPKVDSAMVALFPSPSGRGVRGEGESSDDREMVDLETPVARRTFTRFVTDLYTRRRKQLGTTFGRAPERWIALAPDITPDLRPEALSVPLTIRLFRTFGTVDHGPERN